MTSPENLKRLGVSGWQKEEGIKREDFYPFDYESNRPVAPGYSLLPDDRTVRVGPGRRKADTTT